MRLGENPFDNAMHAEYEATRALALEVCRKELAAFTTRTRRQLAVAVFEQGPRRFWLHEAHGLVESLCRFGELVNDGDCTLDGVVGIGPNT